MSDRARHDENGTLLESVLDSSLSGIMALQARLSISYGIVKEHGGALGFESRPGAGTDFHVDLPAIDGGSRPMRWPSDLANDR